MIAEKNNKFEKLLVLLLVLLSLFIVTLAAYGAIAKYTTVPIWDMWNGYLEFYTKVESGQWGAFWAQHNEHRVFWSHLLFWLDLKVFNGVGGFLIYVNFLLITFATYIFSNWAYKRIGCESSKTFRISVLAMLTGWLFFWSQENNITWGFQSQFFLAQLIPLVSMYACYLASEKRSEKKPFAIACFLGVASAGTMANGVAILPIMVVYGIMNNFGFRRNIVLVALTFITLTTYFTNYHSVVGHGSIAESLKNNPSGLLYYVLIYIGSPFHYIAEGQSLLFSALMGAVLILCSTLFLYTGITGKNDRASTLALVGFILYVGASAFGTAGGRLIFGLDSAYASRYTTPAIMAWAALFVLSIPMLSRLTITFRAGFYTAGIAFLLMLLPGQLKSLNPVYDQVYNQEVAALALELRVEDQLQIGVIFPSAAWALDIAKVPSEQNLSVFSVPFIKNMHKSIGKQVEFPQASTCLGHIDQSSSVDSMGFSRITGWLYDTTGQWFNRKITLLDQQNVIIGYAISGASRPDVAAAVTTDAIHSGFKGYIKTEKLGGVVKIVAGNNICSLFAIAPHEPFSIHKEIDDDTEHLVNASQVATRIAGTDASLGRNLKHKRLENGEQLIANLKRGQFILYRSSAMTSNLSMNIPVTGGESLPLPLAQSWVKLKFDNPDLPSTFDLKLNNNSDNPDYWIEILVGDK